MKRAFSRVYSLVIMLALVASCFTASAASTDSNKRAVFDFLTGEAGFNSAVACGIMANIEHESNFNPEKVARDSNGLLSGGLCMWNGARFKNLQNYCYKNGYNYLSVNGQLRFLMYELKMDYFKHIYNYLKKVSNSASGAYDAAYYWCYYFEVPSNRATRACERGRSARDKYWPQYSKYTAPAQTPLKLTCSASEKTVDIGSTVTFSWTGGVSSVNSYYLYLKQPGQSNYSKISVNGSRQYTLSLKNKKEGSYKAYVICKKSDGSTTGKASGTVSFSVKCLKHDFVKSSSTKPTKTENGKTVYTCSKCAKKKTVTVLSYNKQNLHKVSVKTLRATSASSDRIALRWSAVNDADGYFVFRRIGNKWKLVKKLTSENKSCTVTGLKAGTSYQFLVRAYAGSPTDKSNRVLSGGKKVSASTAPASPVISSISRAGKGQAVIKWNKVKNADGYMVYYSYTKTGVYKRIADVSEKTTSYTAKGLLSGRTVYFKVKAYNRSPSFTAYSACSAVRSIKTK